MAITSSASGIGRIESILGEEAEDLLGHECTTIARDRLHLPGPDFVDRVDARTPTARRRCCARCRASSRTAAWPTRATSRSCPSTRASSTPRARRSPRTPTTSIPRASSSSRSRAAATPSPRRSACSGACSRKYAHRIPFVVKLNHNEFLSYPNAYDQIMFAQVEQAREMGAVAVGRDDLLRLRRVEAADRRGLAGLRDRARARPRHDPLVLPAQLGLQPHEGRRARLPHGRRPDRPGQPPGRHDRGRHHQAEAARGGGARLPRPRLRQDRQARLQRAHDAAPDRHDPLPAGQLLHGPRGPHQLGRRLGRQRPAGRRQDRRDQQARRRHRPDLGPQGVPEARSPTASSSSTRSRTSTSRPKSRSRDRSPPRERGLGRHPLLLPAARRPPRADRGGRERGAGRRAVRRAELPGDLDRAARRPRRPRA